MAKKSKLIPFRWLPGSWGLEGKVYEEAAAHYYYDGEDLDRRLVDLKFEDDDNAYEHLKLDLKYGQIETYDFDLKVAALNNGGELNPLDKLDVDLAHAKITPYEHACQTVATQHPDAESLDHQMGLLKADFEHGKVTEIEYEKTRATANNEPWVGVVDHGFNPDDGPNGLFFQLDWNPQWVALLRQHGYQGSTEEEIVEQWFSAVCQSQAETNPVLDAEPTPFNSGRVINRHRLDGGGTGYS